MNKKLCIRLVDGEKIRNSIDINFTCFGSQADYVYIPIGEFWVEHEYKNEAEFFLASTQFAIKQSGKNIRAALKKEFLREPEPLKFKKIRGHWPKSVCFVDGAVVRRTLDPWFVMGGNSMVYDYVPKGQIWIDWRSPRAVWKYTIVHDMHEYSLMKKGESYENAHDFALALERKMRRANGVKFWDDVYSPITLQQLIKTFYVK